MAAIGHRPIAAYQVASPYDCVRRGNGVRSLMSVAIGSLSRR